MKQIILTLLMVLLFPIISLAGWEHDEVGTRYKNDDGTYKIGWHQDIDGKWYYMDDNTGYALKNTFTPDGYIVNESGVWIEDSENGQNVNQYNNVAEFEVTAYKTYGLKTLKQFGYTLPVKVYYNDRYEYSFKDKKFQIDFIKFEVSNEGVLYASYSANENNYYHQINVRIKYINADGTHKEIINEMGTWGDKVESEPVMDYHRKKGDLNPISAEVYIYVEDVE